MYGKYYQFESDCQHTDTRNWKIPNILFDVYEVQTVLYRVEVWGGSISLTTWYKIGKMQKVFFHRRLGVQTTTPYPLLLLEGIKQQKTTARTSQQNRVVEWMNRTLVEMGLAMLKGRDLLGRAIDCNYPHS